MDSTISLLSLWQVFKQNWWKIMIVVLVVVLIVGAVTIYFIPKKYSSSTEFYIVNVDQNIDYTTSSTLTANQYLAQNYIAIIKGDKMMQHLSEVLRTDDNIDLTPDDLRKMIATTTGDTLATFTVTVTDTDPERAYAIANRLTLDAPGIVTTVAKPGTDVNGNETIQAKIPVTQTMHALANALKKLDEEKYGDLATDLLDVQNSDDDRLLTYDATITGYYMTEGQLCITPLRLPVQNDDPVSPSVLSNCAISGVLAAVVMYVIFFLLFMFNTTVYTEEDVKALTDLPILGTIPSWHNAESDEYSYAYSHYSHQNK